LSGLEKGSTRSEIVRDERDLARRRLLEIAVGGFADGVLPQRQRAFRHQRASDRAGVAAAKLTELIGREPDHDLIFHTDDFEQTDHRLAVLCERRRR
jgi:hypothetical protein